MPTLAEFLTTKLAAAGLTPADINLVQWDTRNLAWGDAGWLPVDRAAFIALAQAVDASDVTPDARVRFRFHVFTSIAVERIFQWNGSDFALVPDEPAIITLTAADLTA